MEKFNCIECGLCCKGVKAMVEFEGDIGEEWNILIEDFPYGYREDGSCAELDPDTNKCRCYDKRPAICDIEVTKGFVSPESTREEWFKQHEESCHVLQRMAGWSNKKIKDAYKEKEKADRRTSVVPEDSNQER